MLCVCLVFMQQFIRARSMQLTARERKKSFPISFKTLSQYVGYGICSAEWQPLQLLIFSSINML